MLNYEKWLKEREKLSEKPITPKEAWDAAWDKAIEVAWANDDTGDVASTLEREKNS